jgi:hypothetical protein
MFSKPNALVYVHRGGIISIGKHGTQHRITFSDNLMVNLDIIDTRAFTQFCLEFFAEHSLRHMRVLVVLDYSIVFEKKIELDASGEPDALKGAFMLAVPLEPEQRATLAVRTADMLRLYATNAATYQCITEALNACGVAKITAIVPVATYNLTSAKQPLRELAEMFYKNTVARKDADFTTL